MHPFDILSAEAAQGRDIVLGLQAMGIRILIGPEVTEFLSCEPDTSSTQSVHAVGAKFQPRDELGRFVAYWVVALDVVNDFIDIEEDYPGEAWD